jgi:hypothetical protein
MINFPRFNKFRIIRSNKKNWIRDLELLQFIVPFNGVRNFATWLSFTQYTQQSATKNSANKLLLTTAPSPSCGWLWRPGHPPTLKLDTYITSLAAEPEKITHYVIRKHSRSITRRQDTCPHITFHLTPCINAQMNEKRLLRIPILIPTHLISTATNSLLNTRSRQLILLDVTYAIN